MAAIPYTYRYSGQFRRYISQFLRIFSGLQVQYDVDRNKDGTNDFKTVKVYYGDMSRIVAKVLQKHSSFPATTLPLLAGYMQGLEIAQQNKKAPYHTDSVSYTQTSTNTPQYMKRQMGVFYTIQMGLDIYASNMDQLFQILEQVLLLFNPRLTIQKSSDIFDWSYLTQVELTGINNEINYPMGNDAQVVMMSLEFSFDAMLNFPYLDNTNIIKNVLINVKDDTITPTGIELLQVDQVEPPQ